MFIVFCIIFFSHTSLSATWCILKYRVITKAKWLRWMNKSNATIEPCERSSGCVPQVRLRLPAAFAAFAPRRKVIDDRSGGDGLANFAILPLGNCSFLRKSISIWGRRGALLSLCLHLHAGRIVMHDGREAGVIVRISPSDGLSRPVLLRESIKINRRDPLI